MPRWITYALVIGVLVSWVPLAIIAKMRFVPNEKPPIHVWPDMDLQQKYEAQEANPLFADNRAMRAQVPGTVARGQLFTDPAYVHGRSSFEFDPEALDNEDFVDSFPARVEVDDALLERGRERFNIYCAPCHGAAGYGNGMVAVRADALEQGTWTIPASFHEGDIPGRPVGHIYNTITNGIRNMPAYKSQIEVDDRWAIVAYVRALQISQGARTDADSE